MKFNYSPSPSLFISRVSPFGIKPRSVWRTVNSFPYLRSITNNKFYNCIMLLLSEQVHNKAGDVVTTNIKTNNLVEIKA